MLKGKTVVVGVCGGIAAYKSCEVVSRLRKLGADVHVIMTEHATEFVRPLTFETLSNNPCVSDMFRRQTEWEVEHISLAKKADLFVVAPATANFVGKFANGIADDMLTTTVMATKAPVLLAPSMNEGMLTSSAFVRNLALLRETGVSVVDGDSGFLACGDNGRGRMAEPESICEAEASFQILLYFSSLFHNIDFFFMPCRWLHLARFRGQIRTGRKYARLLVKNFQPPHWTD